LHQYSSVHHHQLWLQQAFDHPRKGNRIRNISGIGFAQSIRPKDRQIHQEGGKESGRKCREIQDIIRHDVGIMGYFAPSWEDILRRVHGHEQAPMQLSQMTRCQPCKGQADQSTKCKRESKRHNIDMNHQ
jgi:hypothetical protein